MGISDLRQSVFTRVGDLKKSFTISESRITMGGEMRCDFQIDFHGDHIRVELGPGFEVSDETQDEFWNEVRTACERHKSKRVLVEGSVPAGEREASEVIDAGQRTAVVPKLWIAFHLEGFEPTANSELFVAIAATKGIRVKFFSNSKRALNWLRLNAPR